jgi:hypothetical protein
LLISQTLNRAGCDEQRAIRVLRLLALVISDNVVRTSASDRIKICYFQGYYEGLSTGLDQEFGDCAGEPGFECVPGDIIGRLASATWVSLARNIGGVSGDTIDRVFASSPDNTCPASGASCAAAVPGFLSDNDLWSAIDADQLGKVQEAACGVRGR